MKDVVGSWIAVAALGIGLALFPSLTPVDGGQRVPLAALDEPGRPGWDRPPAGQRDAAMSEWLYAEEDTPIWQRGLMSVRASRGTIGEVKTPAGAICPMGMALMDVPTSIEAPDVVAC
jgi:hypothetical protein